MEELIEEIVKEGLSPEQALSSLLTIQEWLEIYYPVAGTLVHTLLKESSLEL